MLRRLRSTDLLATQLGNMGVIYRDMGRLDEALDCFLKAEAGQREVGDRLALGRTLGNIANLYLLLDEFETARKYAFEGLTFATRQGDKDGLARVNSMLGHAAYAQGRFAEALACFETAIVINTETGHDLQEAECRALAALCRIDLGQAAEAEAELNGLLKQPPAQTGSTLPFLLLASRARAEFAQGKRTRAKESLDEALALSDRDSNSPYSSNRVVQVVWQIIDALQTAGIRDVSAPDTIKVRCEHCRRKVRGTRKRLDDLVACPVCKVTPFKYLVINA
ncbi:hypothetical protein BAC2_02319 [uncultured bacterium]|nr:hypothetical protein BAC2_02319 [uncultured bacterium]